MIPPQKRSAHDYLVDAGFVVPHGIDGCRCYGVVLARLGSGYYLVLVRGHEDHPADATVVASLKQMTKWRFFDSLDAAKVVWENFRKGGGPPTQILT